METNKVYYNYLNLFSWYSKRLILQWFDYHQQIRDFKYHEQLFWNSCWKKTKENINHSLKNVSEFLKIRTQKFLFPSPTDKSEKQNIISSLDSNEQLCTNSTPKKILRLLRNDISSQWADTFIISFSTAVFPTFLKVAKVVPVYKKESKLYFSNYRPISLFSIIGKFIDN